MVLELLADAQGGACAIVRDTVDGHVIDQVILNLTALQRAMISNLHPRSDFFQELFSSWKPLSVQVLSYIGLILVLMIIACCVLPLVRGCISHLVNTTI